MAFCINQPVGATKKPVCRLHKQEVLPDVSGIAGMHPVIVSAHQLGHVSFLLDLLSDESHGQKRIWPDSAMGIVAFGFQMGDSAGGWVQLTKLVMGEV